MLEPEGSFDVTVGLLSFFLIEEFLKRDLTHIEKLRSELGCLEVLLDLLFASEFQFKMDDFFTKLSIEDAIFFVTLSLSDDILDNSFKNFLIDGVFLVVKLVLCFVIFDFFILSFFFGLHVSEKVISKFTKLLVFIFWSNDIQDQSNFLDVVLSVVLDLILIFFSFGLESSLFFSIFLLPWSIFSLLLVVVRLSSSLIEIVLSSVVILWSWSVLIVISLWPFVYLLDHLWSSIGVSNVGSFT